MPAHDLVRSALSRGSVAEDSGLLG